jgi:hypothetical protein
MQSLSPAPGFEYYFKICRKGDPETKAITVNESPMAGIADASEITGLPRDMFEVHEISKEEFERLNGHRLGSPVTSPSALGVRQDQKLIQ